MKRFLLAVCGATLLLFSAQASQVAKTTDASATKISQEEQDKATAKQQAPSYPLDTCPITGKEFTKEKPAVEVVVDGRLIRVCCKRCEAKVKGDATGAIKKIDAAVIAEQKPLWPMKYCPVSGEAYGGEMGEPIDYVIGTRYAKLCCKGCIKAVKKDPAAFIAKLDKKVMPALAKKYPTDTCVVSGEKLGSMGDPIDIMYGHRLLRLCCKGCVKAYKKDPAGTVAKVYKTAAATK